MPIRFKISNPSGDVDNIKVYRSATRILENALPEPLAILPSGTAEYTDETAVRNTLYYYRVAITKSADTLLSPNKPLMYLPDTGPGPAKIIRGDYELGYFGRMPLDDLISAEEFKTAYGLDWGTHYAPKEWCKFIVKGKVLYYPDGYLYLNVTFETVYKAGLVYGAGTDRIPSSVKTNYGVVAQDKRLVHKNYQYQPRCPTSRVRADDETSTDYTGGEIDAVFALAQLNTLYSPPAARFDDMVNTWGGYCLTQDIMLPKNCVQRRADNGTVLSTAQSTSAMYRPVLELIL